MKIIVGILRFFNSSQHLSVPTSIPLDASITNTAPFTTDNTLSISPMNSSLPGVSRKLILCPFHSTGIKLVERVNCLACSYNV